MKIYTKTGDRGMTSLVGGSRIGKDSVRLDAYGTVDELNSHLGLLAATIEDDDRMAASATPDLATLRHIRNRLFNLGAYLATPARKAGGEGSIAASVASSVDGAVDGGVGGSDDCSVDGSVEVLQEVAVPAISGIDEAEVQLIEKEIDRLDPTLPQLRSFILPGGNIPASQANIARTVCRRAERRLVELDRTEPLNPLAIAYLNRLSDYLFTLGRHLNNLTSTPEIPWQQ